MTVDDEQLAQNVQNGDKEAFGLIVDRYEKPLCTYIHRLLGDRDNCEDALQETFIKTYKNINAFDTKKKFSSWIYRIAHNEAISHYRKFGKNLNLDETQEISDENNSKISIEDKLLQQDQQTLLDRVMPTLPLKYREVIIFRFYEDRSYDEIAEIMHIPVSTVGTYLKRAKSELKKQFINIDIEEIL